MAISISIIINAFNRREFLKESVNSAIHQSLPRSTYEIIVTKNFKDPTIDKFLIEQNVKVIDSGDVSQGRQLYDAILLAEGGIILLLDYDDLFTEQKLERVKFYFESNPNVVYLHNEYKTMKDTLLNDVKIYKSLDRTLVVRGSDVKTIKKYLKYGIWSNNSSICFKRDFLLQYSMLLQQIKTRIDFFIFYSAAMSGKNLVFTNEKLTIYRIHESESHISDPNAIKDHRIMLYLRWKEVDLILLNACKISQIREIIDLDLFITLLNLRILGEGENIDFNKVRYVVSYFLIHRNLYPFIVLSLFLVSKFSVSVSTNILVRLLSTYYRNFY